MSKPLKDWALLDLQAFLNKNDIEIHEAVTLIGAGACEMHSMAVNKENMEFAEHFKKIMLDCLDKSLDLLL